MIEEWLHPRLFSFMKYREWRYWNPCNGFEYMTIRFHDVEFTEDFGPWPKGYKTRKVELDLIRGELSEDNGLDPEQSGFKIVREAKVRLLPI